MQIGSELFMMLYAYRQADMKFLIYAPAGMRTNLDINGEGS
jgi:hypothetical protein